MKYFLIICCSVFFLISGKELKSQDYKSALGIRGGVTNGLFFETFADEENAFRIQLSGRDDGFQLTLLKNRYLPVWLDYSEHLFVFFGYGAHAGYGKYIQRREYYQDGKVYAYYTNRIMPLFGLDANLGLEYRLYRWPFSFSVEYKPYMQFLGEHFFDVNMADFAFSVKYTFHRR